MLIKNSSAQGGVAPAKQQPSSKGQGHKHSLLVYIIWRICMSNEPRHKKTQAS